MGKKQLIALFICGLPIFVNGSALSALLTVYAARLGADPASNGLFLSIGYFALVMSGIVAGRLSDRFQHRKLMLIGAGLLIVPCTWLLHEASTIVQLTIITVLIRIGLGIAFAMINILTGIFVGEKERGRVFGILGFSDPLGAMIGGFIGGPIVDRWGFPALFTIAAVIYMIIPLAALFLKDKKVQPAECPLEAAPVSGIFTNRTFLFLFSASILGYIANSQLIFTRPLIMDGLHFDATAISTTGAIGGLVGMPLPLLAGWLSDRLGRKPMLIICYLGTVLGLLILAPAFLNWHFWAASILQTTLGPAIIVGSALVTDLFPKERLGTSLSLLNATPFIGFVIGFGASGAAINAIEMVPTLMIGVALSLVAILLLLPIRSRPAPLDSLSTV